MRAALGFVMLLESNDDGRDFRYRLYGSTIARISGFEMTGRLMSSHPASAYAVEFAIASTRACVRRRQPQFNHRHPAAPGKTYGGPRLNYHYRAQPCAGSQRHARTARASSHARN